jgi:DNA repair exonuclease SbcCD ATPase subunit
MSRNDVFIAAALLCSNLASAQDEIKPTRKYEGTVQYQKTKQPATILEFNYPEKDLENALEAFLSKQHIRVKSQKGFFTAKNVQLDASHGGYHDIYYKVEGKGRGAEARSTLYLVVANPGEDIEKRASPEGAKAAASAGAVGFVSSIGSEVGAYDHNKKIEQLEQEIARAERRYKDLVNELKSLEARKAQLEKDIADNQLDQAKQTEEIEKSKVLLEQLKSQAVKKQ